MSRLRFPLLLTSFLLTACGNIVVSGGDNGAPCGAGGHGQGSSTGGSTSPPTLAAIALTRAQDDRLWDKYKNSYSQSINSSASSGGVFTSS